MLAPVRLAEGLHLRQWQHAICKAALQRRLGTQPARRAQEGQRQPGGQLGRGQGLTHQRGVQRQHGSGCIGGAGGQRRNFRLAAARPRGAAPRRQPLPQRAHLTVGRVGGEPARTDIDETTPVDEPVMHLGVDRDAATLQAVDEIELPGWTRAVEALFVQAANGLEQLRVTTRGGQGQAMAVLVEVDVGHGHQVRQAFQTRAHIAQIERCAHRQLAHLRHQPVGITRRTARAGRRLEDADWPHVGRALALLEREERHVERRKGFCVGHVGIP